MSIVIAQPKGCKRPLLLRVKSKGGTSIGTVPDHTQYTEPRTFQVSSRDIIVNLGDDPPYGTAYGVLVEPIEQRWIVRRWGEVFCYLPRMRPELRERLERSLVVGLCRTQAICPALDTSDMITEVRNPKGRINGTYAYRPKGQDVLTLRPMEGQGTRELVRLVAHELGHRVWHRCMTPEQRSDWIKLYARYVHVRTVSIEDIRRMVQGIRQMASVRDYVKDAEPEEQAATAIYLGWLNRVRGIDLRDVNDLVSSGSGLPIPDTHLHRSDTSTPITLYSKTSAHELFSEAVSSQATGSLSDRRMAAMLADLSRPARHVRD